jgi:hypothetical protein
MSIKYLRQAYMQYAVLSGYRSYVGTFDSLLRASTLVYQNTRKRDN